MAAIALREAVRDDERQVLVIARAGVERLRESLAGLACDAEALTQTINTHGQLADLAGAGKGLAGALAQRESDDIKAITAAVAFLACTAFYIILRRVLWAFLGVRIGLW